MTKTQYGIIPIEFIEINQSNKSFSNNLKVDQKISLRLIVVSIKDDKNPYVEELITKNKIGLNEKDNYKVYLPGNIIYNLCSKKQAYLTAKIQTNYDKKINDLFINCLK